MGARGGERGSWEVIEKEREKDLGKVVTGGGEGTGKSKPQRTRRRQTTEGTEDTQKKQTTENTEDTEDTEMEGRTRWAASTRRGGLKWSAQSCGPRRQSWRRLALGTPVQPGVVFLCRRDRRHGKPGGLLHFAAAASQVERAGVRAGWHSETPYVWRVCGSAGVTAGMASLAACSTRTGGVASVAAWSTGGGRGWAGKRAWGFDFRSRAAHNCRLRRIG